MDDVVDRDDGEPLRMSEARFLAWAERQDARFELVEGVVMMQAGATRDHERVAKRIFASLLQQVDEARWDVNKGDFGVRVGAGRGAGSILYPDVVVDRQSRTGHERATTTPVVIVEVLSQSIGLEHHVAKFARYRVRDSLSDYLVFDQKQPVAHRWALRDGRWPDRAAVIEGLGARLLLEAIDATVDLGEVYRPVSTGA